MGNASRTLSHNALFDFFSASTQAKVKNRPQSPDRLSVDNTDDRANGTARYAAGTALSLLSI